MGFLSNITDAIGLTDFEGQEQAGKNAQLNSDRSYAMTKEQIAFQREQYQDWKDIYGDIQENLGNYYKNLDGSSLAALGLENQQREYQTLKRELDADFIKRGISPDSGTAIAADRNLGFQNATARAAIRTNADNAANQEKMAFLGLGLGQGQAMLGNINNAYATGVGAATNMANTNLAVRTQLSGQNTGTINDILGLAAGGL